MAIVTGFVDNGVDLGSKYVTKEYLMDVYPDLVPQLVQSGLFVWGDNGYAQLGTNNLTSYSSPVQTVATGNNWKQGHLESINGGGIKRDGTLWMWGNNFFASIGTVGDNTLTDRSSPVQTVAGGTNWKQLYISSGSAFAIKTDGTLWSWGQNDYGQLGLGDTTNRSSPTQVGANTNWKQVGAGSAIKTDGTLWLWGYNSSGQLGTNDTTTYSSPVQTVAGGTNWKQVSRGITVAGAVKNDGTLWMWGYNSLGNLGTNDRTRRSSPVQTVAGGTDWKQVSVSTADYHTAAIKTDGTLWLWGYNTYGELGTNNRTLYSSPVQTVAGGTNWKQVSLGSEHTAAIKIDGTLWVWGRNDFGQLATNDRTHRSSPVQTVAGGNNWKYAAAGANMTCAIVEFGDDF